MKKLLTVLIIICLIFNINLTAMAANTSENITINQTSNSFLISDTVNNPMINMFSPDDHNLDLLIGVILSVVPGFGVGDFWLGNQDEGWLFLKLDLVMLAIPIAITIFSTIFSSLGIIKADSMSNTNVFTILGLVAWASALGIKIWEVASVWRYAEQIRTREKSQNKVSFSYNKLEYNLVKF
ncbi:MAG: hypothetical protein H7263_15740 [Candidatus Sericytochromatia bacterium]|nr:hypothetical protein [Candidatus Sericytochromatia bacterium]